MPQVIRVRDVTRDATHEIAPGLRVLRVPYDMFSPVGAVRMRGDLVEWLEGNLTRSARFAEALSEECHVGERVLVRLAPYEAGDEWWLCEVEATE
jgi:hypothetical protein